MTGVDDDGAIVGRELTPVEFFDDTLVEPEHARAELPVAKPGCPKCVGLAVRRRS